MCVCVCHCLVFLNYFSHESNFFYINHRPIGWSKINMQEKIVCNSLLFLSIDSLQKRVLSIFPKILYEKIYQSSESEYKIQCPNVIVEENRYFCHVLYCRNLVLVVCVFVYVLDRYNNISFHNQNFSELVSFLNWYFPFLNLYV